jgi:hypothetical protein
MDGVILVSHFFVVELTQLSFDFIFQPVYASVDVFVATLGVEVIIVSM